jgi:hypothetical protein
MFYQVDVVVLFANVKVDVVFLFADVKVKVIMKTYTLANRCILFVDVNSSYNYKQNMFCLFVDVMQVSEMTH